ncbi:7015_t:CDS:2, partial [Gigaspora rosea]
LQVNKYTMDLPTVPTAWDVNDKSTLLNVDANGLNVLNIFIFKFLSSVKYS